ncbi:hypothetical protein EV122DRAFT_277197 [Schizophyllum commune]
MSSTFTSIAIASAQGVVGQAIVQSLASIPGISTLVLTRKSTLRPAWLPAEAAHAGVDYDDVPGTAAVLREHKVEVVIFPGMGILQQIPLADAAKAAGVQLFVPSEFGTVSKGFPKEEAPEFLKEKLTVAEHLEAIGLPYARVYLGIFHDFALHLIGYTVNKKVNILKGLTGNTPFSFTHTNDIGGFVAYIVTHYPLPELAWKSFRIEGEHVSFNELAALLGAPAEKVEAIPTEGFWPVVFLGQIQTFIERGLLNTETKIVDGDGAGGANHLWKGHKWTGVKEGLNLQ